MQSFQLKPAALPDAGTDLTIYFNTLFQPGTTALGQLVYEIQREFRFNGSPDVKRLRVDRVSFDEENLSGKFRVLLDIDFTFGCEDLVSNKQDQTSEWNFSIDKETGIISFAGSPFAGDRSTADEF